MCLSAVGSVFPDIDLPFSNISRLSLNKNGNNLPHRGITHWLVTPLSIYLIYYLIFKNQIISPFIIGYISHLFLDAFNSKGVKLPMPVCSKSFKFPLTVKTQSVYDYFVGIFFWAIALLILFK